MSDTDRIEFRVRTETITYGDGKRFAQYRILFYLDGRLVGLEEGPHRYTVTSADARKAARERIGALRKRRLYAIPITARNIRDGEARSCSFCAVAQALHQHQKRMGFDPSDFDMRLEPYGLFQVVRGIVAEGRCSDMPTVAIPVDELPLIVPARKSGKVYGTSMVEWAMEYDNWADAREEGAREWRKRTGNDYTPGRPLASSFVLDLDAFAPAAQ